MLTVIIETRNAEQSLPRTLAPLVSGAVDGLLREVIVQDWNSTDHTVRVAEQAGCTVVEGGSLSACIKRAKGDWLLLLEAGSRLGDGWIESVERHIASSQSPAKFSRSRTGQPGFLQRIVKREAAVADGLLISKRQALSLTRDSGKTAEDLARGLAARRMNAEIVLAGR
jgi:glycosyltransferase involved in cell wall biosynthesis